jgi:PAS domain S-box-containing protein
MEVEGAAPRILLVEDEDAHAELVRRAFDAAGVAVDMIRARNLREAHARLAESRPDLVVADLRLPDGDGAELLSGDREPSGCPVVIMTSHGDEQVAVSTMRTGALDYVVKSETTLAQMPRVVERALRESRHIAERRRAEEALRESEEHFRILIENGLDMIQMLGEDKSILYVSPSCERVLGQTLSQLRGQQLQDLIHPEDRERAARAIERALSDPGSVQSYAVRLRGAGGRWRVVESMGRAHLHAREGLRVVLNSRDVTEREQAEAEKRRLEAQLRHARKMETLGTLAGGIAHDFNNILQAIVGCTELAQHVLPDENPAAGYLKRVVDGTGRARKLVRQILTFSRQDEPERRRIPLQKVVDESLLLLRATLPSTIEIQRTGDGGGSVLADPTQLQQVLMNLCTNAQHAMEGVGACSRWPWSGCGSVSRVGTSRRS